MSETRLERTLTELDQLVNWERRDRDAAMRQGLGPVREILAELGDPQRNFRSVHVGGTKGKGTTSALIAAGLQGAGIRTGLYTSPHVSNIQERVRIDGANVRDDLFANALERALAVNAAGGEASWFDILTAAAFRAFAAEHVEWAVVEVGLGGRLDSTNAIDGEVCVITSIDLEHTNVLGNTRAAIAREKAGILKRGSTLVCGVWPDASRGAEEDAGATIEAAARALDVPILRPATLAPTMFARDLDLARLALDELGRRGVRSRMGGPVAGNLLDEAAIAAARLPARGERRRVGETLVVLDGAHVASSVGMVLDELSRERECASHKPVVILALGRDKNSHSILKQLAGRVEKLVCTTAASGPLAGAETLASVASAIGIEAEKAEDPARALARALDLVRPGGWILVIGSFHLAGAVRGSTTPDTNTSP